MDIGGVAGTGLFTKQQAVLLELGQGCLVVASTEELIAFIPTERLLPLPPPADTRPPFGLIR